MLTLFTHRFHTLTRVAAGTRFATVASLVVALVPLVARGTAIGFVYDAGMYWAGPLAILSGGDVVADGGLALRGLLSSLLYLPAAAAAGLFGAAAGPVAVLIENSLVIAFLGSWIVPRLASKLVPLRSWHIWVSSVLVTLVFSGFAPYPLMDVWALVFLLFGVLLLASESRIPLLAAGASFAITLDLRPAFLVPVIVVAVIWTTRNLRRVLYPAAGGIAGFLPQVLFNRQVFGVWSPFAPETLAIAGIQSASASFLVRYDTVAFVSGVDPRLSYCSPTMATIVVDSPPSSTPELLMTFVQHPLDAVVFAAQKASASVAWEWETPYSTGPHSWLGVFGILTAVIAAVGIVALVRYTTRARNTGTSRVLLGIWLATTATVVVTSPEARFGAPLLATGIVGLLTIAPPRREAGRAPSRRGRLLYGMVALIVVVIVVVCAANGLAHPAPPGPSTAAICTIR